MPALAVADALRDKDADVSFLGARGRPEAELIPAAGYEVDFLRVRGLDRGAPLKAVSAATLAAAAVPAARKALRRRRAEVVMGGGGYVAGPAGLAALSASLPLVLTEADRHLGLANRVLARRARRVCLAFPIPGRDAGRYLVTGRPVPAEILAADRDRARRRFQIAGHRDYPLARQRLDAAIGPERYTLLEYEPTLADPLAACDLVLARAGGSVFELAAAGRPAILVPYPHATARHQDANAAWMSDAGAALVIDDSELDPGTLVRTVAGLFADGRRLERMAAASRALARPDAAKQIANEILEAART